MGYLLAALPILVLLFLMIFLRWGGHIAGPISLSVGILVAILSFGLNLSVFSTALAKGLLLSLFVLMIIWPAMLLYQVIFQSEGIRALTITLQQSVSDTGFLWIILAWCFSAFLEGIAGFGLPIAIIAPILVALGVKPILAVAAVAIGHAWAVTFGDMGVVFQALIGVVNMSPNEIVLPTSILLGLACLLCGIVVAVLLKQTRQIHYVILIGIIMAGVQAVLAYFELITMSGFLAGLSGLLVGLLLKRNHKDQPRDQRNQTLFHATIAVYFVLSVLLIIVFWPGPLRTALQSFAWVPQFQQVTTNKGFITQSGSGQAFRLFVHPGFYVFIVSIITTLIFNKRNILPKGKFKLALENTWKTAAPASLAIMSTIVLSAVMEHAGLTQILARGLNNLFGNAYPLVSPMVGMLGAFATGSNTSSNVIFGGMQKDIATLLQFSPAWMVAAQTTGGALGSMLSPAKIVLGSSTVGLKGKEGSALKITIPIGIGISLVIGLVVLLLGS